MPFLISLFPLLSSQSQCWENLRTLLHCSAGYLSGQFSLRHRRFSLLAFNASRFYLPFLGWEKMNSNSWWAGTIVLVLLFLPISSIQVPNSEEFTGSILNNSAAVRWEILTKSNYSSEIRRHTHLLLLVTVPWSGESRSLMKELASAVASQQDWFGTLKLMLLYRNTERVLANTLGASEGNRIIYFHHSSSYKYGGRLRAQNILSSVQHVMSLLPKGHPLRPLNTEEELRNFLDSTDKALLLLEFCGWTSKLLEKGLSEEANGTLLSEKRKQKGMGYYQMSCKVNNRPGGLPWLSEFTLVNDSFSPEVGGTSVGGGFTCSLDDLQRFQAFLPKFMNIAREFLLPPDRVQFGLISERALLPDLKIEATDSWLMTLHYSGCPSCSKVLTDSDDLKMVLQTQESVVGELGDDMHDLLPTFPADKPSILLFIDRSSSSPNIRTESKDVLQAFRKLALNHKILDRTHGFENILQLSKFSKTTYNPLGTSGHPRLFKLLPAAQKLILKDKTSTLMLNDGKQIIMEKFISDFRDSSLNEMLTNLLQQKKELKLSSLAKDAGFQLLSEDFEIKAAGALSSEPEKQSDQDLELSDNILKGTADLDDEQKLQKPGDYNSVNDEDYKTMEIEPLLQLNKKDPFLNAQLSSKSTHSHTNDDLGYAQDFSEDRKFGEEMLKGTDDQKQQKYFSGSFFFCDGNFRLLRALTGGSRIPSVVIIDPIGLQHYIIPANDSLSYSSLSDFVGEFLNGSLTPYQQSEPVVQSSREARPPPFVNLDFHEADSIPRVTVRTFTELVLGNKLDIENPRNAWDRDVLVLFSNNWCGFCQRMELIVREVYRAIKSYAMMFKSGEGSDSILSRNDNTKSSLWKVPLIYLMDCTMNDCSLILKTAVKREVYPSLLLFPAVSKEAIAYEGDLAVSDILNFLADHGILVQEKGIIWHVVEQGRSYSKSSHQSQTTYHEVLLKDNKEELATKHNQIQIKSLTASYESTPEVVVGSILTATDMLLDTHPFDKSKILIVKVDQGKGIEGLITNKLIKWDSLEELEEGLELLKDAPLSFGGPVIKRRMALVALSDTYMKDQHVEVLPGVYFIDQWEMLQLVEELRLGNQSLRGCWFFLGFTSWGWNQLFAEIAEGAWHVSEGNVSQLDWPKVL